jgi:TPR repeat protein
MIEVPDTLFTKLGLRLIRELHTSVLAEAGAYEVEDTQTAEHRVLKVYKQGAEAWDSLEDANKAWQTNTRGWNTKDHGESGSGSGEREADQSSIIKNLQLNWLLAERSGHRYFPRVYGIGSIDGFPFQLREYSKHSLTELLAIFHTDQLYDLVSGIWAGLTFLHQPGVNTPHGNVKAENILINSTGMISAEKVLLSDALETRRVETRARKSEDFRRLGLLVYKLAHGEKEDRQFERTWVRADAADWSSIRDGRHWKNLCCTLLAAKTYDSTFDPFVAREQLLDRLKPRKAQVIEIAGPVDPPPGGAMLLGDLVPAKTGDAITEIDLAIDAEDYPLALRKAVKTLALQVKANPAWHSDAEPELSEEVEELLARIDKCSVELLDQDVDTGLVEALDKLLEHNHALSSPAVTLVGLAYFRRGQSEEAFSWLFSAVKAGYVEASRELALLYERGAPSWEASAENAVLCLQRLTASENGDTNESNLALAALILRGTAGESPKWEGLEFKDITKPKASDAVKILQRCAERGHPESVHLLAQCHATGTGVEINEKRGFDLFIEAVERGGAEKPSAQHNLGICYEIGYGTPKDAEEALECYDAAAARDFEPSRKAAERLEQAR